MKSSVVAWSALAVALIGFARSDMTAQAQAPAPRTEFIDIRWDGTSRMCVIYPDGKVDFFYPELKDIPRPDDADKRAFYLTLKMNRMAAQGYEFVGMISDEIIMKRTVR
ncbi:MAG TPA: hypothetical protein VN656_14225 [Stellaceae bacterium]|jgi:hypothetical protein|nr:hypothetical protein [Stellaceae bacterium]